MPTFLKNTSSKISYVFNVSSTSVSAAVVKFEKNKPPKILYSTRKELPLVSSTDFSAFLKQTAETLRLVAEKIRKEGYLHLNFSGDRRIKPSFYCFLGAPWTESEMKVLHYEKENMLFSKSLLDSIVGREEGEFEKISMSKFQVTVPLDLKLIEKKTVSIELNGYQTNNPFGKTANSADISVFISIAPKNIIDKFQKIIQDEFHETDNVKFQTLTLAATNSLIDIGNEDDFTLIDITGEITDLTVVNDGSISEMVAFPLAKNTLVRTLAKKFATSEIEVISILKMYNDNSLSPLLLERIRTELDIYGKDFINMMLSVVTIPISQKIFLLADSDLESTVKHWSKSMKNSVTVILEPVMMEQYVKGGKNAEVYLSVESMFINKIINLQTQKVELK